MTECRSCLVKNVRMHKITDTRYREMFEKITGKKLGIEIGKSETICYICKALLQRFLRFFEISQKNEQNLTTRIVFGAMIQSTTTMHRLSTTVMEAISYIDNVEEEPVPEVVVIKEELDEDMDVDEWEQFKEDCTDCPQTEETKIIAQAKEITNLGNAEESIKTKEPLNKGNSNSQNLSTEEFPIQTEESTNLNKLPIKEKISPLKEIRKHQKRKQKHGTYFYCDKCEYRSRQTKTLVMHSKFHDPNNQFACNFCLYRFPEQSELMAHNCTACRICRKKFHNATGVNTHMRLHTDEQPYACDLCGRGFNQKTNLQTHLRVHAREKQYPCEICHKIFPFAKYLKRHMLIHSDNYLDNETKHRIKNCHKLFSSKKKVTSSCTVCGKNLRTKSMSMHMRLHSGGQPFSCEKCHKFFNLRCNLVKHIERCHRHDPLFACQICFKTFPMNSELRKHLVTHEENVENKKESMAKTEPTMKKFISRCEKKVEQRMEAWKTELMFNLGLKPKVVKSQEPDGTTVIPNFNEGGNNEETSEQKDSYLDLGQKAMRRARGINILRNSVEGIINRIRKTSFSPKNTKVNIENISAGKQIIKCDSVIQDAQEKDFANPEKVTGTYVINKLQRSDPPNDTMKKTDQSNSLTTEDFPEPNSIFVATNRYIKKDSNVGTQNTKEVEIKREFQSKNKNLTENEVFIESVDNIKATEDINQTNEATNENDDDMVYLDENFENTKVTEQDAENEEIAFTNEDLKVTEINLNKNSLAGSEEEKTANKEVLATEELEDFSQVLLSDEDVAGVEVSVIDPNDLDDSDIDSEEGNIREEHPDLSDELIEIDDDNFKEKDVPSDEIIDLTDAEDKRDINNTPQQKSGNEPIINLRSDLFANNNDDKFKVNLNVEINLETNNRISTVKQDNISTKEACIDLDSDADDNDVEFIPTKENSLDDVSDAEYLEMDSNYDNLETIATNEDYLDDISDVEDLSSDYNATPILVQDFDVFQHKHQIYVHRRMNKLATPYICELCD